MTDYTNITHLSFDCYGTLIDWKKGVTDALMPLMDDYNLDLSEEEVFEIFAGADRELISGKYRSYADILMETMDYIGKKLSVNFVAGDRECILQSLPAWKPFPDTREALSQLSENYSLNILSNIDEDLFRETAIELNTKFDRVITSEEVKSYKPAPVHFREAQEQFECQPGQWLHVAQSIYHDIRPAKSMGIQTVWVNRYGEEVRTDPGEFPDLEVPDLKSLVTILNLEQQDL